MNATAAIVIDRDVIDAAGSEAGAYLQGQLSQDIDAIAVGGSAWSLVLQPTGKVDSWFRVHRTDPDRYVLDLDAGHGAEAVERLERFRLRTDVEFRTVAGWRMVSIKGPIAADLDVPAVLHAAVGWPGFEGVDHLGPEVSVPPGVREMDPDEYEAARIRAAWPALGAELTEETIPGEGGEALLESSVSFTKGCYTGQELVARIDSRGGNVPRPIRVLEADSDAVLPSGAEVVTGDGAVVGRVTSSAPVPIRGRGLALARVQRKVDPGTSVVVAGVVATVR